MRKFGGDFDDISNNFENAIGYVTIRKTKRTGTVAPSTSVPQSIGTGGGTSIPTNQLPPSGGGVRSIRGNISVHQAPTFIVPPPPPLATTIPAPPAPAGSDTGGGGGGGGGDTGGGDTGTGTGTDTAAKDAGAVPTASHITFYVIGGLIGAGIGYFIAGKMKKSYLGGALIGGSAIAGLSWVYFNKIASESVATSAPAPATTPTTGG